MPSEPQVAGIRFNERGFANPATGFTPTDTRVYVGSEMQNLLTYELQEYLEGRTLGRACLISGHRGSGKTTLVDNLIAAFGSQSRVRPLAVRLHGPSLLSSDKPRSAMEKSAFYNEALRLVVVGLYQSAAEKLFQAFAQQAAWSRNRDAPEMAAQLRITLDGAPSLATLRYFWDAIDALDRGILRTRVWDGDATKQGMRELVAIASAADAYRSCVGTFTMEQTAQNQAGRKQELKLEGSAKAKELTQALLSLLAGAAVGTGAIKSGTNELMSSLAGVATALASMAALTYTSTMSRDTQMEEKVKFLPDLTTSSLVHRMALLLTRFYDAGLAPVFIIDELDKVKDLKQSLVDLASYLKFICADRGFFCFLTDRDFLSEITIKIREDPNCAEQTVFTDRVFCRYSPASFHEFLSNVLRLESPETQAPAWRLDLQALSYILVHRSRMRVFRLAGELGTLISSSGWLKVGLGDTRKGLANQFILMMQLAIELVLLDAVLARRVHQDPEFAQVAYDALYFPALEWSKNKQELDASRDTLLESVTALPERVSFALEENDKVLIYSSVVRVLRYCCEPELLKADLNVLTPAFHPDIIGAVPLTPKLIVLVPGSDEGHYRWRFDQFGNPFQQALVGELVYPGLDLDLEITYAFASTVQSLKIIPGEPFGIDLQQLSDGYSIFNKTPSLAQFVAAAARVKQLRKDFVLYPEAEADVACVKTYAVLLRTSAPVIARAVVLSAYLSCFSVLTTTQQRFQAGMTALSRGLDLATSSEQLTNERINMLLARFDAIAPLPKDFLEIREIKQPEDLQSWKSTVEMAGRFILGLASSAEQSRIVADGWRSLDQRLATAVFLEKEPDPADIAFLRCMTQGSLPATILPVNLRTANISDWSDALARVIVKAADADPNRCPLSIAVYALAALGFNLTNLRLGVSGSPEAANPDLQSAMPVLNSATSRVSSRADTVPGFLIIRPEAASGAGLWRPNRNIPAVAITKANLANLFSADRLALAYFLRQQIQGVVLEIPILDGLDQKAIDRALQDARKDFSGYGWPDVTVKPIGAAGPVGATGPAASQPLLIPKDLEDLRSLWPRLTPSPPV